ncbi:ATP-binding protein [Streptomyces sp. NPDC001928]|uniref:ATP-binding protein n=1 Tax=Streptomyces sp. NPDC001928 TaxID=3154404 RepID=UPI00332E2206
MTAATDGHIPHPYVGGRSAALRALTAWRTGAPGAPRVLVLTGNSGSGCSRLLTGFLMLCDPEFRNRLPLRELDPSTVPPELPAPVVPAPTGRTASQVLWLIADHHELRAASAADVFSELASLDQPTTIVVPDVDRAGPVRATGEPARVVREVLAPLAATETVRLLTDVPRPLAHELAAGLPADAVRVIDLDEPEWADPESLAVHMDAALDPRLGAPDLPFTADPEVRRALAAAIGRRAGTSRLVVQLAARSLLMAPDRAAPTSDHQLPASVGEALDLHALRVDGDPQVLRLILTPLALAEGQGLPADLWGPLTTAVAGQDMTGTMAGAAALASPFLHPVDSEDGRTLLRLRHPAVGDEIRAGLPSVRTTQARIAAALLEAVPDQDWSKADPYVRDYVAGHAYEAGLLPQLLTDPGLFVYADPVPLRAAVEAVPRDALGAPAHTYLRIASLLTRTQAPPPLRAALLETAFVEDGLPEYAAAVHRLGLDLPWRTLWSLPLTGMSAVTIGTLPGVGGGAPTPVAAFAVPEGTAGAHPVGDGSALVVHGLVQPVDLAGASPEQILRLSEEERLAAPLMLSRGADYVRVWDRNDEALVAELVSETPYIGSDLSPDSVLLVATERGARALRITAAGSGDSLMARVPDPSEGAPA